MTFQNVKFLGDGLEGHPPRIGAKRGIGEAMADSFDPYHKWLGISPKDQPPNHYRLLAIELFENDLDVIEGAADRQMAHVRTFQTGQNSAASQRILNELSAAKLCLLDPKKKAEYDRQLRAKIVRAQALAATSSGVIAPAAPAGAPPAAAPARPVPIIAAPAPLAKPVPQSGSMPAAQAALVVGVPAAAPSIHPRRSRKTPPWRKPAVLGTVGALVLFSAVAYYVVTSGMLSTEVAKNQPNNVTPTDVKQNSKTALRPDVERPSSVSADAPPETTAPTKTQPPAAESGFEIIEANWIVGDNNRNVTEAVRDLVKDNRLMMIVWSDLFHVPAQADDGRSKKLRIRYRLRGNEYRVEYPDSYFVYLNGNPPVPPAQSPDGLEVLEARYGAGKTFVDVSAQARGYLRDGLLAVNADQFAAETADELAKEGIHSGTYKVLLVRYRNATGEHFHYAWNSQQLVIESRFPPAAGPAIDLLKKVDLRRDVAEGAWKHDSRGLHAPGTAFARVELPYDPPDEYMLLVTAEGENELKDLGAMLVVGGRQVMSVVDGFQGLTTGLQLVDGKEATSNGTSRWRGSRLLEQARPNTLVYLVRRDGVRVVRDGAVIIYWSGDPSTLSIYDNWKVRNPTHLSLQAYDTPFRVTRLELTPLAPEKSPEPAPSELAGEPVDLLKRAAMASSAAPGLLKVFEDEPAFVQALRNGDGQAMLATDESYSGKASIMVTGVQRFGEAMPGLRAKIRTNPNGPDEYRYLQFAWKKLGGREICLQLHYPSNWFNYSAGPASGFTPAIKVDSRIPTNFTLITRDLAADFGEFDLDGFALSAMDGEWARFDHIYLARSLEDFGGTEEPPTQPPPRTLADLASNNPFGPSRPAAPDDETVKKARQELKKKYAGSLKTARAPEQKRRLAGQLSQKAAAAEGPQAYVLWNQAIDLAEAAGDLDLAWQTIDSLAQAFDVDRISLRNESLATVGKGVKSPEAAWTLTDAACRLMVSALAAGDAAAVKKAGLQAQVFAKRMNDRAAQKEVTDRVNDAGKWAGEWEAVAAAREMLKTSPGDPQANFTVGHYELCAAGNWEAALPKLAKCGETTWKKLAADELAQGPRTFNRSPQPATADRWWSLAENEPWPGRHFLRMRAALRYGAPNRGRAGDDRLLAVERLKTLLALDEGLPNWELFQWRAFPRTFEPTGDVARIDGNGNVETAAEYAGPIEVLLIARTSGTKLQMMSHCWGWGWDFTLVPDQWHTLRYVINPLSRTVFVDGALAQTETWRTPRQFNPGPVSFQVNDDSVVEIRKFIVKPLE